MPIVTVPGSPMLGRLLGLVALISSTLAAATAFGFQGGGPGDPPPDDPYPFYWCVNYGMYDTNTCPTGCSDRVTYSLCTPVDGPYECTPGSETCGYESDHFGQETTFNCTSATCA